MANCLPHFIVDCVARETSRFLRIRGDWKGRCGTSSASTPLCGPLVLLLLEEFRLVLCNSTSLRFMNQKFEIVGGCLCI